MSQTANFFKSWTLKFDKRLPNPAPHTASQRGSFKLKYCNTKWKVSGEPVAFFREDGYQKLSDNRTVSVSHHQTDATVVAGMNTKCWVQVGRKKRNRNKRDQ